MKLLVVVLAILALVYAKEWKVKTADEIKAIHEECFKAHPISAELVDQMEDTKDPDEEAVRQYLLCMGKKVGVFDEQEGFIPARVAAQYKLDLSEAEVLPIAQSCADKNEQGSPVDVWYYRGHKCFMDSEIGEKIKSYLKKKREELHKSV